MKISIPRTFGIGLFLFLLAPLRQDAHALPIAIHPIVRVQSVFKGVYARLQNNSATSASSSEAHADLATVNGPGS